MTPSRILIGRDAIVVRELPEGLDLAGRVRLRPGYFVDVVFAPQAQDGRALRRAFVWSWVVVSLGSPAKAGASGSGGPLYRGICRWDEPFGNSIPTSAA